MRCHHVGIGIGFALLAFVVSVSLREETRSMIVDVGIEVLLIEIIDQRRPVLGDVGVAELLSHHRGIFTFGQGVVVGMTGA